MRRRDNTAIPVRATRFDKQKKGYPVRFRKPAAILLVSLFAAVETNALNILVTNDDGYQHPWLRAVQASLIKAGHQVTVVAPATDQSGKAASLTLTEAQVDNPEPGIYAVHGTPATSVQVGVRRVLKERPDLVVSGANDGANIGVISTFSGTVGAAVAALLLTGEPIPAIAISGNRLDPESKADSEINLAHGQRIADFLARLVARLEAGRGEGGALLPEGIALNVNYPAVPADQVKGVGIYRHDRDIAKAIFGSRNPADLFGKPVDGASQPTDRDAPALQQGYVTIVPIDGDFTATQWQQILPGDLIDGLKP